MAKRTDKQRRFVEEYLIDLTATQAAIRAGYSPKSAAELGSRLLKTSTVRSAIDEAMAERSRRTGVNADRVLRELARVGFANAKDIINDTDATLKDDITDDDAAAVASIKVKTVTGDFDSTEREIKLHDKIKALELMGKHLGMFQDNVHLTGDMGVQIINDVPRSSATS